MAITQILQNSASADALINQERENRAWRQYTDWNMFTTKTARDVLSGALSNIVNNPKYKESEQLEISKKLEHAINTLSKGQAAIQRREAQADDHSVGFLNLVNPSKWRAAIDDLTREGRQGVVANFVRNRARGGLSFEQSSHLDAFNPKAMAELRKTIELATKVNDENKNDAHSQAGADANQPALSVAVNNNDPIATEDVNLKALCMRLAKFFGPKASRSVYSLEAEKEGDIAKQKQITALQSIDNNLKKIAYISSTPIKTTSNVPLLTGGTGSSSKASDDVIDIVDVAAVAGGGTLLGKIGKGAGALKRKIGSAIGKAKDAVLSTDISAVKNTAIRAKDISLEIGKQTKDVFKEQLSTINQHDSVGKVASDSKNYISRRVGGFLEDSRLKPYASAAQSKLLTVENKIANVLNSDKLKPITDTVKKGTGALGKMSFTKFAGGLGIVLSAADAIGDYNQKSDAIEAAVQAGDLTNKEASDAKVKAGTQVAITNAVSGLGSVTGGILGSVAGPAGTAIGAAAGGMIADSLANSDIAQTIFGYIGDGIVSLKNLFGDDDDQPDNSLKGFKQRRAARQREAEEYYQANLNVNDPNRMDWHAYGTQDANSFLWYQQHKKELMKQWYIDDESDWQSRMTESERNAKLARLSSNAYFDMLREKRRSGQGAIGRFIKERAKAGITDADSIREAEAVAQAMEKEQGLDFSTDKTYETIVPEEGTKYEINQSGIIIETTTTVKRNGNKISVSTKSKRYAPGTAKYNEMLKKALADPKTKDYRESSKKQEESRSTPSNEDVNQSKQETVSAPPVEDKANRQGIEGAATSPVFDDTPTYQEKQAAIANKQADVVNFANSHDPSKAPGADSEVVQKRNEQMLRKSTATAGKIVVSRPTDVNFDDGLSTEEIGQIGQAYGNTDSRVGDSVTAVDWEMRQYTQKRGRSDIFGYYLDEKKRLDDISAKKWEGKSADVIEKEKYQNALRARRAAQKAAKRPKNDFGFKSWLSKSEKLGLSAEKREAVVNDYYSQMDQNYIGAVKDASSGASIQQKAMQQQAPQTPNNNTTVNNVNNVNNNSNTTYAGMSATDDHGYNRHVRDNNRVIPPY